jgi:hypothetical protein
MQVKAIPQVLDSPVMAMDDAVYFDVRPISKIFSQVAAGKPGNTSKQSSHSPLPCSAASVPSV